MALDTLQSVLQHAAAPDGFVTRRVESLAEARAGNRRRGSGSALHDTATAQTTMEHTLRDILFRLGLPQLEKQAKSLTGKAAQMVKKFWSWVKLPFTHPKSADTMELRELDARYT